MIFDLKKGVKRPVKASPGKSEEKPDYWFGELCNLHTDMVESNMICFRGLPTSVIERRATLFIMQLDNDQQKGVKE